METIKFEDYNMDFSKKDFEQLSNKELEECENILQEIKKEILK